MKIHEYQAKAVLARAGIAVPRGAAAASPEEAAAIARGLRPPVVLKAQIHAGGRGLAGGVRAAATPEEAGAIARAMLGTRLRTAQTGPEGALVRTLLVEESIPVRREFYLGLTVDRALAAVVLMASAAGGVDLEAAAAADPESVVRKAVFSSDDPVSEDMEVWASRAGLAGASARSFGELAAAAARAFFSLDASLLEINPLGLTEEGGWAALDARMAFDDNALPRHPELASLRDPSAEDPRELEAAAAGLSYVRLGGDIGCLVNGAGLAMATADLILSAGGRPADFLDIGGGVREEAVRDGFRLVAGDPGVKAVLINVFGGIVRCDLVARGVVRAARESGLRLPLVVRMHGTNAEDGRRVLAESGLAYETAEAMDEAAARAVALAAGARPS